MPSSELVAEALFQVQKISCRMISLVDMAGLVFFQFIEYYIGGGGKAAALPCKNSVHVTFRLIKKCV